MPNKTEMDHYDLWLFVAKNKVSISYDAQFNNVYVRADSCEEMMDLNGDHSFFYSEYVLPTMLKLRKKLIERGTLIE